MDSTTCGIGSVVCIVVACVLGKVGHDSGYALPIVLATLLAVWGGMLAERADALKEGQEDG